MRGARQAFMRASAHRRSPGARRWDAGMGWKGGSTSVLCSPAPSAIYLFRHQVQHKQGRAAWEEAEERLGRSVVAEGRAERCRERKKEENSCSNRREAGLIGANMTRDVGQRSGGRWPLRSMPRSFTLACLVYPGLNL